MTDKGPTLKLEANLADFDGFYEKLIDMHRDLDDQQSKLANAKLILLLANHIGERAVLEQALALARKDL